MTPKPKPETAITVNGVPLAEYLARQERTAKSKETAAEFSNATAWAKTGDRVTGRGKLYAPVKLRHGRTKHLIGKERATMEKRDKMRRIADIFATHPGVGMTNREIAAMLGESNVKNVGILVSHMVKAMPGEFSKGKKYDEDSTSAGNRQLTTYTFSGDISAERLLKAAYLESTERAKRARHAKVEGGESTPTPKPKRIESTPMPEPERVEPTPTPLETQSVSFPISVSVGKIGSRDITVSGRIKLSFTVEWD